jgi:hypothetical protein
MEEANSRAVLSLATIPASTMVSHGS